MDQTTVGDYRPILLVGGPGQGKTTSLREITKLIQAKSGMLQIYLPFHDICYAPEFFDQHSRQICVSSLEANSEGLAEEFVKEYEKSKDVPLRVFKALTAIRKKYKIDFLVQADEIYDLNVLKSYPGHGKIFKYFIDEYVSTRHLKFLFTTSFQRKVAGDFEAHGLDHRIYHVPSLTRREISVLLSESGFGKFRDLAQEIQLITFGNPGYVKAFIDHALRGDPPINMNTVISSFMPGAALELKCRFNYEYLVGKSRGDGIVKYLLAVIAMLDLPNLTEIARNIDRSLGVTKDYLKWMLAVGLIDVEKKRYFFKDNLLRMSIGLFKSGKKPSRESIEAEINNLLNEGYERERLSEEGMESPSIEEISLQSKESDGTQISAESDEIILPQLEKKPSEVSARKKETVEKEPELTLPDMKQLEIEELD